MTQIDKEISPRFALIFLRKFDDYEKPMEGSGTKGIYSIYDNEIWVIMQKSEKGKMRSTWVVVESCKWCPEQ